jgi:hypothetical protein
MSDPGDQYQPFFDAIRAAHKQVDDAQAGYSWAARWDPVGENTQWIRVEQARSAFRLACAQLIDYIILGGQ